MRARYRDAIYWLVANDDIDWLLDPRGCLSVTASLVADLFGKTDAQVTADIRREAIKQRGSQFALPDA